MDTFRNGSMEFDFSAVESGVFPQTSEITLMCTSNKFTSGSRLPRYSFRPQQYLRRLPHIYERILADVEFYRTHEKNYPVS